MVNRPFAWIDENIEHSDDEYTRATALAKKWSALQTAEEERRFRREYDRENGYDYDPSEDCECDFCLKHNHKCRFHLDIDGTCTACALQTDLTECEVVTALNKERAAKQAERDLEIELVEDKLAAIGARMQRPYEHWNEDERYMEYMENKENYLGY